MKKSHIVMLADFLLVIPLTLFLCMRLPGRGYYITSTLVIVELIVPFLLAFESRKPQARELVVIAVLSALAVAARVVIPLPHFKAIFAIIMLSGIAFGPEAGFLTGALTAFVSNFIFGQGPWTPWQMLGFGLVGFLGGLLFYNREVKTAPLIAYGFLSVLVIYGVLLDTASLLMYSQSVTWNALLAVYASGFPFNLIHAAGTAVFLLLLKKPVLSKLRRIKIKYGMMD